MTIEKLPSGSYRVKLMENGKRYSITVPYKPSEKQAYQLIREKIDHPESVYERMTFCEAFKGYIKSKSNVLSPTTLRGYNGLFNGFSDTFKDMQLKAIDQATVQAVINDYSSNHSPKSVRNAHGLIVAVIKFYMPSFVLNTTLPQRDNKEPYIPTEDDIRAIMEYAKDTDMYVPLYLGALGLRRSEMAALTIDDLDGNILHINKAKVLDQNCKWVIKHTNKTDASTRDLILPNELIDKINEQGYIYDYAPGQITKWMNRVLPKLGIPNFSYHKMRHFFASYMSGKFTSEQIQRMGGWQSDHVLKKTYSHAMNLDQAKKEMAESIGNLF